MAPFTFWGFIRWAPVLCLVAMGYFLVFAQSLMRPISRHLPLSETRVWFFSWLVTAPPFMALRQERPLDVLLVMTPPICLAAAEGLGALLSLRQVRKPRIDILVALGSIALGTWFTVQGAVHALVQQYSHALPHEFFRHLFRHEFGVVLVVSSSITLLLSHFWLKWKKFTIDISPSLVTWAFALLFAGAVAGNAAPSLWFLQRTYHVRDGARSISTLPENAVVAGLYAPLLALDSRRTGILIWPVLNSPGSLGRHGVTHLLLQRGTGEDIDANLVLRRADSGLPSRARLNRTLPMGRGSLNLYDVTSTGH
jgi:hypothetical protein